MISGSGVDMILGMYHLRKMHLYFAFQEQKLYATVAAARPEEPIDPLGSVEWQRCLTPGRNGADIAVSGCTAIIAAKAEAPDHIAVAALQLDPKYASALYGRGQARKAAGDDARAQQDIDAAKQIRPDIEQRFGK